jgi:hypothetical protein
MTIYCMLARCAMGMLKCSVPARNKLVIHMLCIPYAMRTTFVCLMIDHTTMQLCLDK